MTSMGKEVRPPREEGISGGRRKRIGDDGRPAVCTHTGRPLGDEVFVHELEEATKRCLAPRPQGGAPQSRLRDERQGELVYGA